jgi:hypothetical protein
MWKPWAVAQLVGSLSHEGALANARNAATELSRLRVERAEIELYVARRAAHRSKQLGRQSSGQPA